METTEYLFVYGTLRSEIAGSVRHEIEDEIESTGPGFVFGDLFDLGFYPGAKLGGNSRISGELLKLKNPAAVLPGLDRYEGFVDEHSEYVRTKVTTYRADNTQVEAWIYLYNGSLGKARKIEGDYVKFLKMKQKEYGTSSHDD